MDGLAYWGGLEPGWPALWLHLAALQMKEFVIVCSVLDSKMCNDCGCVHHEPELNLKQSVVRQHCEVSLALCE